jgi:hypothetical protein
MLISIVKNSFRYILCQTNSMREVRVSILIFSLILFSKYMLPLLPLVPQTLILFDRPVTVSRHARPLAIPLQLCRSAGISTCWWYKRWVGQ